MAKRKPKKRVRNKNLKSIQNEKLKKIGLSQKDINRLSPTKRKEKLRKIENNEKRKSLRQEKKEYLNKNNITFNYTINGKTYTPSQMTNLSYDNINKIIKEVETEQKRKANEIKKEQRRIADKDRENRKIKMLLDNGFNYDFAYSNRRTRFDDIEQLIFLGDRTVYTADAYLSVLWSDVTGDSQMGLVLDEFSRFSTAELIEQIHNIYENVQTDGSDFFKGVPLINIHNSKQTMQELINDGYWRGYTQKTPTEKDFVVMSNQWTLRGFANCMLSVMSKTSNDLIRQAYHNFENYAYEYLPEIYEKIF